MKKHASLSLSLFLALALAAAASPARTVAQQSSSLINNGDFESGASGWQGLAPGQLVRGDVPSGQKAVKLTSGEATQGPIPVTPGKNYVLTAWFKWTAFSGEDWGYDRIAIFDPDSKQVASLNNLHTTMPQNNWQKVALSFTPQTPTVRVSFGLFGPQKQAELYFDGFALIQRNQNLPPQLSIQANQASGEAPLLVGFTSNATDPDGAIAHYNWDFGDGSVSTQPSPQHTFISRGSFPVRLTVWDNDGASVQQSLSVTVTDHVSPSVQIVSPTLTQRFIDTQKQVQLQGVASATGGSRVVSVVWDNISTGLAGIAAVSTSNAASPGGANWTTGSIELKSGTNEILITATDDQGRVGAYTLIMQRTLSQPVISNISNLPQSVPVYDEVEVSFDLDTVASVPFYRYDPSPPAGIPAGVGVSVAAVLTTPSGKTLTQPGFYTTLADRTPCGDSPCFHQTNQNRWMVRFSPQEVGSYRVALTVQDASGKTSVSAGSFQATQPGKPGFIRVSQADPRYFEFSNGQLYWPGGPASGPDYAKYQNTGLNLERPWMAGIGAYSTNFARWMSTGKQLGNEGFDSQLTFTNHFPGHQLAQLIQAPDAARLWIGWQSSAPYKPVLKAGSQYQVMVRFKTEGINGPVDPAYPYGFMIKKTPWPSDTFAADNRSTPSMIPIVNQEQDWHTLVNRFTATSQDADQGRPYINLYLDNVSAGKVYIDQFSLREVLPDDTLGGEMIVDSNANLQSYVDPSAAAYIDWQVQQGEQYGIYFKYVAHDKRDWIQNHLLASGVFADKGDGYYQPAGTAAHWLLEQWWRYMAARWGYSTAIHSWELNNEGPPDDPAHYQLAQDFARFMHQTDSHPHLVTTSFWSGWQGQFFGNRQQYPDIDYGDVHEYIQDGKEATNLVQWQLDRGATYYRDPIGKPILRGETGIGTPGEDFFNLLKKPNNGAWYHNLLWSELGPDVIFNPNYWWSDHIQEIDMEAISQAFSKFVSSLDVNAGGYVDAIAAASNPNLRVIGQKNPSTGQAFLWVQNQGHTWLSTISSANAPVASAQSGIIKLTLKPRVAYTVEWWDTSAGTITSKQSVASSSAGVLALEVSGLQDDVALKVYPQ